jgi:RNA polymerase sigma factor (sigma-70 family)
VSPKPTPIRPAEEDRRRGEALFLSCLSTVKAITASLSHRFGLDPEDARDFRSTVYLRLIADNYGVLRKFRGRSTLAAYLSVTIRRILLDDRNAKWGKWRPSVHAVREGPLAVLLARLTMRDRLSFDEACATLRTNYGCTASQAVLARLHSTLAFKPKPRWVTLDAATDATTAGSPADGLERREATAVAEQVRSAVGRAVAALTIEDRRLLDLRFRRGLEIAAIARMMNLNQKRLYSRFERLLRQLRTRLESAGVTRASLAQLLTAPDTALEWWEAVSPLVEKTGDAEHAAIPAGVDGSTGSARAS